MSDYAATPFSYNAYNFRWGDREGVRNRYAGSSPETGSGPSLESLRRRERSWELCGGSFLSIRSGAQVQAAVGTLGVASGGGWDDGSQVPEGNRLATMSGPGDSP